MINKTNSILFNQEWINKVIEEGRMDLLPSKRPEDGTSIGEYLENIYHKEKESRRNKVTKNSSLIYDKEWAAKFREENIHVPKNESKRYSLGEYLEAKYFRLQMVKTYKKTLNK